MTVSNLFKLCLIAGLTVTLLSCAQSEEQKDFESEAFVEPAGIQAMTVNGTPTQGGESDSDDWRIGPDFSGSITIETPAHPNPVQFGADIEIDLNIGTFGAINGLQVYAFQQPTQSIGPLYTIDGELQPGLETIIIDSEQFASSTGTGNFGSLFRIILYDNNLNVISYGDVQVQY